MGLLQLQNALRHRLNDIGVSVPDLYQSLAESIKRFTSKNSSNKTIDFLKHRNLSKRVLNPHTHLSKVVSLTSTFSKCIISSKEVAYKLFTIPTLGIFSRLSGSKWISFIILASRTGSSFLRNMKDFLSQALRPEKYTRYNYIYIFASFTY